MANRKRSKRRPQPRHKAKRRASRRDKRSRLDGRNPQRKKTTRAKFPLVGAMQHAVATLQDAMDRRIVFRLAILVADMFFADGHRTAACWFAPAGVQDDGDQFDDGLISIGRQSGKLATAVLGRVARKFVPVP
jgi:hypothetical protein